MDEQIEHEVHKLQSIKLGQSTVAAAAAISSEQYRKAKAEAEAAVAAHGKDSKEAAVAWETVFELVSTADESGHTPMGSLDDECALDVTSAKCVDYHLAMDELQKAIVQAKSTTNFNKANL